MSGGPYIKSQERAQKRRERERRESRVDGVSDEALGPAEEEVTNLCRDCGDVFVEADLHIEADGLRCDGCKSVRDGHAAVRTEHMRSILLFAAAIAVGAAALVAPQHPVWRTLAPLFLAGPVYVVAGLWVLVRGLRVYADQAEQAQVKHLSMLLRGLAGVTMVVWAVLSWGFYSPAFL